MILKFIFNMSITPVDWIRQVARIIYEKKGKNVIAIDVCNTSSFADYILIATGNVDRHVIFLAQEVERVMRDLGQHTTHIEGLQYGDWIVLDYCRIVIHLFIAEMRKKYQLERLWPGGTIVALDGLKENS